MWQALSNCIPVCDRLADRHCGQDHTCARVERRRRRSTIYCLNVPRPSKLGRLLMSLIFQEYSWARQFSVTSTILWKITKQGAPESITFKLPWILWYLWKTRNDKVFNGKDVSPQDTLQIATSEAEVWKQAQIPLVQQVDEAVQLPPSDVESTLPPLQDRCFIA